jgi:ABC-type phosphate transport system substrate-binding protein
MPVSFRLAMSLQTLTSIYTGNITWWNDTRIQQENPSQVMPAQPITVVIRNQTLSETNIFSNAASRIDPYFNQTCGVGMRINFNTTRFASWLWGDAGLTDPYYNPIAVCLSNPYSITYSAYGAADSMNGMLSHIYVTSHQQALRSMSLSTYLLLSSYIPFILIVSTFHYSLSIYLSV